MKKKSVVVLLTVTMVTEMTAAGCGDKQLALATDRVSVELGYELNTDVAAYVADADIAVETTIDFGAVDVSKLGTYTAVVTYKDQTASLEVDVVDTTAPEAEVGESGYSRCGRAIVRGGCFNECNRADRECNGNI